MTDNNEQIEVRKADPLLFPANLNKAMEMAGQLVKSGLCPNGVSTPAQALAVLIAGREIGLPPMQAMRNLYVVNGKVAMTSSIMAALVRKAGHGYQIIEHTASTCTIDFWRKESPALKHRHTFTMEDAQRAGLTGKDNWKKYPAEMLYARCFAAGARIMFPDILAGYYAPEELGAIVDEEGDIVEVQAEPVQDMTKVEIANLRNRITELEPDKEKRGQLFAAWKVVNHIEVAPNEMTVEQTRDFADYAQKIHDGTVDSDGVVDEEPIDDNPFLEDTPETAAAIEEFAKEVKEKKPRKVGYHPKESE